MAREHKYGFGDSLRVFDRHRKQPLRRLGIASFEKIMITRREKTMGKQGGRNQVA